MGKSLEPIVASVTTGPGAPQACIGVGHDRQVTITLASPLGARVLIDEKRTSAIAVTQ
jgi:hypothetical protein